MDERTDRQIAEIRQLMEARLGLRGRDLSHQLDRAGRSLPRRVRRAARELATAERLSGHPRLSRQVDPARMDAMHDVVAEHLKRIDPKDRRRGRILGLLGTMSFNLLLLAAIVIVVLVWRGFV